MKKQGLLDLDQTESREDALPLQYGHPSASNGPKKGRTRVKLWTQKDEVTLLSFRDKASYKYVCEYRTFLHNKPVFLENRLMNALFFSVSPLLAMENRYYNNDLSIQ